MTVEIASIKGIELYDADMEREHGVPEAVEQLKERIASADGLILVTPEYNNSLPGVLKNAIDWLTRPPRDIARVFGGKPVALMGATPGQGGTRLSQLAWLPVLRTLGTRPWFGSQLHVGGAGKVFDGDGELVDGQIRERLADFMSGFATFVG
jgi:NAD(P)H-dependent FMN reductase